MADIKTVIKTLDHCIRSKDCLKCEYLGKCKYLDKDVLELLKEQQAEIKRLKAEQPKHGHWIEQEGFDGDVYYDCSVCGESWVTVEGTPEDNRMVFCPHCGAKMDEPKDGDGE